MIEDTKIVKAISLINKLTKQGELIWTINRNSRNVSLSGEEKLNGYTYETKYNDQSFRLFKFNSTYYIGEFDTWETTSHHRLSIIESSGASLWDFPMGREIDDLYDTVRFKTSNIESFLNSLTIEPTDDDDDKLPF